MTARRQPGWLSIVPLGGALTLVHAIRKPGSRPEVRALDVFAAESGERDALQRLRSARKLNAYACTTLIGVGQCTMTQMDAPPVPPEERREALRWALKDVLPYPVDNACVDVLDIPSEGLPPGRPASVLVVSASEHAVRECVAPFEAAGVRLDVVDAPELAQRNVAALLEDDQRGLAFLRLDETGMMLTLTFRGELIAVRRGEITSSQLAGGNEEQRTRVREKLALELQRSLDNFDRQYSHIPVSRVVLAVTPPVPGLCAELGASTYVPVADMDLSSVLVCDAVPELRQPECQARYLLALGAALRTDEGGA